MRNKRSVSITQGGKCPSMSKTKTSIKTNTYIELTKRFPAKYYGADKMRSAEENTV
jgi:hypothetical protein